MATQVARLLDFVQNEENIILNNFEELRETGRLTNVPVQDPDIESPLFNKLKRDNAFSLLTNLPESQIIELFHLLTPVMEAHRTRGAKPKLSVIDSLLVLLIYYKTHIKPLHLSPLLSIPEGQIHGAIDRLRHPVNEMLKQKWWATRIRPQPLNTTNYPQVALAVDSSSQEVYRPKGRFEEAKSYWDAKNHVYALKKQVAVLACEPHYAMFSHPGVIGSKHDYTTFKETFQDYIPYLRKIGAESTALPGDLNSRHWAVVADRAYIGPESDTPNVRRITPTRGRNPGHQAANIEISKIRVPVECFFGRMQSIWRITAECYRNSHVVFDVDYDNCVLLTNEHIRLNRLNPSDEEFATFVDVRREQARVEKERKRKGQWERYYQKKKVMRDRETAHA